MKQTFKNNVKYFPGFSSAKYVKEELFLEKQWWQVVSGNLHTCVAFSQYIVKDFLDGEMPDKEEYFFFWLPACFWECINGIALLDE